MNKNKYQKTFSSEKTIIKKCHLCGFLNEGKVEMDSCGHCKKGFLPLNYFTKVHVKTSEEYSDLFESSMELHEDDLIKGLYVLW